MAGWLINKTSAALDKLKFDATSMNISCRVESIENIFLSVRDNYIFGWFDFN
jgi:hypothetical protein